MPYYEENKMAELRRYIEDELLLWQHVEEKKMFGCPSFKAKEKLFAIIITDGIVITKLNDEERNELSKKFNAVPFKANNRRISKWAQLSYKSTNDLKKYLPYIKKSYKNALQS